MAAAWSEGMRVDAVLGLSMTPHSVGVVLVGGQDADGATMDGNAFDVRTDAVDTPERAADAVRRTEALAAERGLRLHSIGVTWSEDADAEASVLIRSLADAGFDNVVPVRMPAATEALARGMAEVIGHDTTAVCVVEPDAVITLIVNARDGAVQTAFNHAIDSDESLAGWLSTIFTRADWQPEALVLVGSAGDFSTVAPFLEDVLSVPVYAPEEAQLALARGAALASAQTGDAPLDDEFAAFATRSHAAPRSRRALLPMAPAALLVAGVVTFVASVSVAISLEVTPTHDAPSPQPAAAADAPAAPVAARAVPSVLSPPVAVPPSPEALPPAPEAPAPAPEAPPVEIAQAPETAFVPEAPAAVEEPPVAAPEYPPAEVPATDPALVAPPVVASPPQTAPGPLVPNYAPAPTKKPGILSRIRDKLRFGDDEQYQSPYVPGQ